MGLQGIQPEGSLFAAALPVDPLPLAAAAAAARHVSFCGCTHHHVWHHSSNGLLPASFVRSCFKGGRGTRYNIIAALV